VFYLQERELSK
jgi:N-acyl homoserine lactone hydrolase